MTDKKTRLNKLTRGVQTHYSTILGKRSMKGNKLMFEDLCCKLQTSLCLLIEARKCVLFKLTR